MCSMRSNLRAPICSLLLTSAMLSQDAPLFRETTTLVTVPCTVSDAGARRSAVFVSMTFGSTLTEHRGKSTISGRKRIFRCFSA